MIPATRTELPQRRSHTSFEFEHWGTRYSVGLGHFPDGRLGEVFINTGKVGTQADVLGRDSAVLLSIALQSGVTIADLRHAVARDPNGLASGPIGALLDLLHDEEEAALTRAVGAMG
jgi:hypothetical protein